MSTTQEFASCSMQLSPARGRLLGALVDERGELDAAYPREGTVTNITCFYRLFENDAAYPREGTVTHVSWCKSARAKGCSLAPRGDGYDRYFAAVSAMPDAAYPREGTVTPPQCVKPPRIWMQLIPARGRLRVVFRHVTAPHVDAAYPREGTVTERKPCSRHCYS